MEPADRPNHRDHADYEDLVSGAALGILTPDEHADLMAYLETDRGAVLRDDLAELMEVAAALPHALDPADTADVQPSAGLRDRLQAAIAAPGGANADTLPPADAAAPDASAPQRPGLQRTAMPATAGDGGRSIFDAAPQEVVAVAPVTPIAQHPRFAANRTLLRVLAAVALVALLAGSAFVGYQLAERNQPETDDSMMAIALDFATPLPSDVVANLQYDPRTKLLMLSTTNMPAAPADHVYQVWLIGENGPQSAGMMGESGFATMMDSSGYTELAITVEPGPNGSPGPTTQPIVVASLKGLPSS
ncbi:MAG: anti-sigma factor domain-containing protein [Thermomicrobiales bacterium]